MTGSAWTVSGLSKSRLLRRYLLVGLFNLDRGLSAYHYYYVHHGILVNDLQKEEILLVVELSSRYSCRHPIPLFLASGPYLEGDLLAEHGW
jgi:hypothetical protein